MFQSDFKHLAADGNDFLFIDGKNLPTSFFNESVEKFKSIFNEEYYDRFVNNEEDVDRPFKRRKGDDGLLDLQYVFSNQTSNANWLNEINLYLQAPCANEDVNILHWGRDHETVYPILSKMAKDYLSVMVTSVPVERLFSNTSQIMRPRRR